VRYLSTVGEYREACIERNLHLVLVDILSTTPAHEKSGQHTFVQVFNALYEMCSTGPEAERVQAAIVEADGGFHSLTVFCCLSTVVASRLALLLTRKRLFVNTLPALPHG
jgi:hypothetical protein